LKADIWIVPHQLLFQEAPLNLGQIAFVIIDESPWKAGLGGVEGNETLLFISSLRDGDDSGHPIDSSDWIALERYRHKALSAIIGQGNGPITRYAMAKAGLTEKAALHARLIEFKRLIKMLPALPGLSAAQRKARLSYASGNRTCMNAVRFWEAIAALLSESGPEKSGWAQVVFEDTSKKREGAIRLRWRKEIRKDWQVPTLIIDALFQPELVRPFWPQLKVIAGAQAAAPHEQVWQVIDQAYSKGHLEPLSKEHEKRSEEQKKRDEKEAQRRLNNRRKVRAIICSASRAYAPGRVLVVIQKSVKEALQAMGTLPANVVLAHHNAIAGRDEWGDVSCLVVVGRTSPPPENVESMAMALTGAAVSPLSGWYPTNTQHRHLSDGTLMPCSADYHPDQVSEAIRWHIVVGEVIQIVGRGRGVNRTAANPLDVLVLTDVPLPIPLHAVLTEASVKPTAADLMLAEGGFAFSASRHAADAYPGLWSNHEAAKKAIAAAGRARGIFPLRDINSGRIPRALEDLPSVEYQRRGPGQHAARAQFDPLVVRNPEAELQALLGQLEKCGLGT
jgi:putative DNA primase/helicase